MGGASRRTTRTLHQIPVYPDFLSTQTAVSPAQAEIHHPPKRSAQHGFPPARRSAIAERLLGLCALAAATLLATGCAHLPAPQAAPSYEVVLLVGQSNMSGRGLGADPLALAPPEPRLLMWDPSAAHLATARDPLPHQDTGQRPVAVGPGISFGRSWLAHAAPHGNLNPNTRLILVPAAYGGTGFSDRAGSWRVTGATVSPLAAEAVARANAALQSARVTGATVRFAAILWHQGETDGGNGMDAAAYKTELTALASYLRGNIEGATAGTPFLVGQYVPSQITSTPALAMIAEVNKRLPDSLAHSACVSSTGLSGNPAPDTIHFNATSQRAMGERYAAALAALLRGEPAADCGW